MRTDDQIREECDRIGAAAVEAGLETRLFDDNPTAARQWHIEYKQKADGKRIRQEMRNTQLALGASWLAVLISLIAVFSQIYIAKGQRELTLAQLKEQRDDTQKQLRAYVYVQPPPAGVQRVIVGSTALAVIAIRNSGQTPAYDVKMRGNIGFGPYPLRSDQRFIEGPYGGSLVLNPGGEATTGGEVSSRDDASNSETLKNAISQAELDSIRDGKRRRLYLFGSVAYRDAFGAERHSDYCFAYYGTGRTLTLMNYCDSHNGQH